MKRSILRWIHIVLSIPILGSIDSPFEDIPYYAPAVRIDFFPALVLSGFRMWRGGVVRRPISKCLSRQAAVDNAQSPRGRNLTNVWSLFPIARNSFGMGSIAAVLDSTEIDATSNISII